MLSRQSLKEILELLQASSGSFIVLEQEEPKIVVLDFPTYEKLVKAKQQGVQAKNTPISYHGRVLLTSGVSEVAQKLLEVLPSAGWEVLVADGAEELEKILAENKIDQVIHWAESVTHAESVNQPDLVFETNVKGLSGLLEICRKHTVDRILVLRDHPCNTPLGVAQQIGENILSFYHQAYGFNSVSLRMPKIVTKKGGDLFTNPVEAILQSAKTVDKQISLPAISEQTLDNTPEVRLLSVQDAAEAVVSALHYLADSSGAQSLNVDGHRLTLGSLVEKCVEISAKMIVTTHETADPLWDLVEDAGVRSLSSLGWQPKESLDQIVIDKWNEIKDLVPESEVLPLLKEAVTNQEPVSLSELLSGKFTPFIRPHKA